MFAANYLQILGLRYTDASRAAFLQQLSTVLVPVAAAGMGLEVLTPRLALGALCALAGVAFLTLASAPATTATAVAAASLTRLGDALEIVSALLFAVYLLRTAHHVHSVNGKSSAMVAVKVITQATLSCLWLVSRKLFVGMKASSAAAAGVAMSAAWTPLSVALNVLMVLWGGVMVSGLASWMQTKGQQVVPASEAAILFAAQPLWASVVAYFVFGETMGVCGMAGAGMIVAGTVVSSVGKKGDDA